MKSNYDIKGHIYNTEKVKIMTKGRNYDLKSHNRDKKKKEYYDKKLILLLKKSVMTKKSKLWHKP